MEETQLAEATPAPLNARQRLLWGLYDYSQGRGLEVGPLHQTAAPKDRADVVYLDVLDRERLVEHYASDPGVPCELIPDIDYALFDGERVRSIPETVGPQAQFDWVVASHVIEHVPDAVGWLDEIAQVTTEGGHLVLAVPDRRYCFDLHRPGTTVGQLIQAHELGDVVPSVRAVYDYKRGHASVRAPSIWAGEIPGYERRIYPLDTVLELVARARAGEYIDSHVWTFTPGSFLEQIIELRLIGLSSWKIVSLTPTRRDQLEFYVILERLPRDGNWPAELFADEPPQPSIPDWVAEHAQLMTDLASARAELAQMGAETKRRRSDNDRLSSETTRLRSENKLLRERERNSTANRIKRRLRDVPGGTAVLRRAHRLRLRVQRARHQEHDEGGS